MKQKHNGGFSLIEILVAIVLLGAIVVPTCTSLVMSVRMNAKTEEMLQAQLAVSSAVETLMAEGIKVKDDGSYVYNYQERFPDLQIDVKEVDGKPYYYEVMVRSTDDLASVTTYIRQTEETTAATEPTETEGSGG